MKKVMLLFFICVLTLTCIGSESVFAQTTNTTDLAPSCKSAYLCDWRTGTAIYSKDETKHLPIASMCKIMTMQLCFEEIEKGTLSFEEEVCISERASGMGGSQVFLETGGIYKVSELIKSICIASANDSCVATAERIAGNEDVFVSKMNEKAKSLGMNDTVFVNCTGLPQNGQYSCSKDVATMFRELLRHEEYFNFSKIWMEDFQHSGGRVTQMANTNKLIRNYQGCDGGKTGYTAEAGFCLSASAIRGNMRVISVVIGASDSKSRFAGVSSMFDYAFANYENRTVLEEGVMQDYSCEVSGGKEKILSVRPEHAVYIFCKKGDSNNIFYEVEFESVRAPIARGDVVGTARVYKDNIEVSSVKLLANEDIEKNSYFDSLKDLAENWNY